MRFRRRLICSLLAASICCTPALSGCSSKEESSFAQNEAGAKDRTDSEDTDGAKEDSVNLGEFSLEDINGEAYTQEMFAEYDLTMVNVFDTWCSPCVKEIPDLEKLHQEMGEQGVNVAGIVLDTVDGSGKKDEEGVEKAKLLAEKTGASYPFLIPDEGNLNGIISGVSAVPTTFFVDKEGNIVGEIYTGARSFQDWKSIVEGVMNEVGK